MLSKFITTLLFEVLNAPAHSNKYCSLIFRFKLSLRIYASFIRLDGQALRLRVYYRY